MIQRDEFMPFSGALVCSETPTALFSIWTRVVDSISYGDNHYAMRGSKYKKYQNSLRKQKIITTRIL